MAYRPYLYVPEVRVPDDSRIQQLMLAQTAANADQIRDQGRANALLWAGIGRSASGMMSDLAQYKREAPIRAEQERQRREADKLRGLEQMAGAAMHQAQQGGEKFGQEEYGQLLQREGFVGRGQDVLDKEMKRKADTATYENQEYDRTMKRLGRVANTLNSINQEATPEEAAAAYAQVLPHIRKDIGDKASNLPDVYDKAAVDVFVKNYRDLDDVYKSNQEARAAWEFGKRKEASSLEKIQSARTILTELVTAADTAPEWDEMWGRADQVLSGLSPEERKKADAYLPFARQFSDANYKSALEVLRGPQKAPTSMFDATREAFRNEYGHYPQNETELAKLREMQTDPKENNKAAIGLRTQFTKDMQWIGENVDPTDKAAYKRYATQAYNNLRDGLALLGMEVDPGSRDIAKAEGIDTGADASGRGTGGMLSGLAISQRIGKSPDGKFTVQIPGTGKSLVLNTEREAAMAALDFAKRELELGGTDPAAVGAKADVTEAPATETVTPPSPPRAAIQAPPWQQAQLSARGTPVMRPTPPEQPPPMGQPAASPVTGQPPPMTPDPRIAMTNEWLSRQGLSGNRPLPPTPAAAAAASSAPAGAAPPIRSLAGAALRVQPKPEEAIQMADMRLSSPYATIDERVEKIRQMMALAGFDVRPISTTRTAEEQAELYRQGRTPRSGAEGDESQHQRGTAADFAFFENGERVKVSPKQRWDLLKLAAAKVGLEWGGDYKTADINHVELPPNALRRRQPSR